MDPFGNTPRFDGTGFQHWKVLMKAHLQTTGLDVWRVVSEGITNTSRKEKQNDVIAKSIILYSLSDSVFNGVFSWKMVKSYGRLSKSIMRA